jgi:hypothetical protein
MEMEALFKRWDSELLVFFWALASQEIHEVAANGQLYSKQNPSLK